MTVKITCINKAGGDHENPYEAVDHYGWKNETTGKIGKTNRSTMVGWIKKGNHAYVIDNYGNKVYCFVKQNRHGTEFLQTQADSRPTNNLLELPECL